MAASAGRGRLDRIDRRDAASLTAVAIEMLWVSILMGPVVNANDDMPLDDPPVGLLAFAAVYALPAALGVIGFARRRPEPRFAAGLLCLGLAPTAFSGVALPLILPGVLFLVSAVDQRWTRRAGLALLLAPLLLGASSWVAVVGQREEVCFIVRTTATGRQLEIVDPSDPRSPAGVTSDGDGGGLRVESSGDVASGGCTSVLSESGSVIGLALLATALTLSALADRGRPTTRYARAPEVPA